MKRLLFLLIIFSFLNSCYKNSVSDNDKSVFNKGKENIKFQNEQKILKNLPVPYKKLEAILGKDFIPVNFLIKNTNNDSDEELIFASKKDSNSNIDITIFEQGKNDSLKKRYEISTEIFNSESLLIQTHNLFSKDDICLIIEGKTKDDRNKLYTIIYADDEFKNVGDFSADYSIVINYDEIEDEKGKYSKIKDLEVVNSSESKTNSNLQKKEIYIWDPKTSSFIVSKTEQISSSGISSIDQSILYSEEKYFEYIKGFWYPEKYKQIIDSNKLNPDDFSDNEEKVIFISTNPNELSIKYGNYVDKYSVVKITKSWNQRPGLRLVLKEYSNPKTDYNKFIDITLMERDVVSIIGPEKYDNDEYVRLPKPFSEYVNDKKEEIFKNEIEVMEKFLAGKFENRENIQMKFGENKEFIVSKGDISEKGVYKITAEKNDYLISFLYESTNTILKNSNFIIKVSKDTNSFSITPVKFDFSGFIIEDLNLLVFVKK
jgi:hypothetical protein